MTAMTTLRGIISGDPLTWDRAWKASVTPWDMGSIQPPLREAFERSGLALPRSGRALVPGCGGGYDAVYIASLGLDTLGLDISQTAIAQANRYLASQVDLPERKVTFAEADFFTFTVPDGEKFDLIYDYTFFVAIPPQRRLEWGRQMTSLLKPGGYLITLVFPIDEPVDHGPPFFVRPEHYCEPLGDKFVKVLDKIPDESSSTHVDRERLVVWRRV